MAVSAPCTTPEISRAGTLQRAEEGSGTDFVAVLQAARWGIFHRRPEKEGLGKRLCKKQVWQLRHTALSVTLL